MRPRATELECLRWWRHRADFGPAHSDVVANMDEAFMTETSMNIPDGWNIGQDGETCLDKE